MKICFFTSIFCISSTLSASDPKEMVVITQNKNADGNPGSVQSKPDGQSEIVNGSSVQSVQDQG